MCCFRWISLPISSPSVSCSALYCVVGVIRLSPVGWVVLSVLFYAGLWLGGVVWGVVGMPSRFSEPPVVFRKT